MIGVGSCFVGRGINHKKCHGSKTFKLGLHESIQNLIKILFKYTFFLHSKIRFSYYFLITSHRKV